MREVRLWLKKIIQGRFELAQIATAWVHHLTPSSLCRHQTATAPVAFFKPWVTSLLQSHLATRPTSVMGHWAIGPFHASTPGDGWIPPISLKWLGAIYCGWFVGFTSSSAHSLEIVGTLGLILVAGTAEGQKISLPQAILKAKQCSRAGKPFWRAGIQSQKIREHRLSFKHDYMIIPYHTFTWMKFNRNGSLWGRVATLRRQETRPGGVWWRSGSWSLAVGGWFMPCQGGKQSEVKGHEKVHLHILKLPSGYLT